MVTVIERYNSRDEKIRIEIVTNDHAHSLFSDHPEIKEEIVEAVQLSLTRHLRKEAAIAGKEKANEEAPN